MTRATGHSVWRMSSRSALRGLLAVMWLLCGAVVVLGDAETQPALQPASRPASQPASQPTSQAVATTTQSQPTTTTQATTTQPGEGEPAERWLAVVNGRVHTVTGPVLDGATVLCKDGVISAIGTGVALPAECQVVDAAGREVYPGLVAAAAGGIHGGGDPADTTNVYSLNMLIALAGGITTAIAGDHVAKLTFGTTEGMVLRSGAFLKLKYSSRDPLARAKLRADLERVRAHVREVAAYERQKSRGDDVKPPDKEWIKGKYDRYLKLLRRELVGMVSAGEEQELRDVAELAQTFGFDLVVRGAHEGWRAASALGRAGAAAIVTPRADVAPDERLNRPNGSTIENARILREHGVRVAVIPNTAAITVWGLAGRDLLHLNMEAAFAVRGGMSNDDALKTITIDAARVLGVDDRVGSLEVGKDADLLICDGDLLHYMTQVHTTIVNGRVVYEKAKESLFAHIRPEGKPGVSDFDDQWPRQLTWPD